MKATLEDLYKELWLRDRNIGNIVWETREGLEIPINEMDRKHLLNTIAYLERKAALEEIVTENQDAIW